MGRPSGDQRRWGDWEDLGERANRVGVRGGRREGEGNGRITREGNGEERQLERKKRGRGKEGKGHGEWSRRQKGWGGEGRRVLFEMYFK